jgi:hypothetical protein
MALPARISERFSLILYRSSTPPEAALCQIDAWMESPGLALLAEGGSH